jgi:modulator of FtsH protease HflK
MTRRWLLLLLLVAALIGYGLTGLVQVRSGELAVVRRFGRVLTTKAEPGLWIGLPWGMDRVDRVVVDRVQSVTVGFQDEDDSGSGTPAGQLLTGDHNLVNVQVTIFYKARPEELADFVDQADQVDGLISRSTEALLAEWVAGRDVDDVLLNGKTALWSFLVKEEERLQRRLDLYRLGVQVLDARVTLMAPPADVKAAFDDVARAQTEIRTRLNGAEQNAEAAQRMAESDKFRTEQETAAYVGNQKLLAHRDAERFLERLRQYERGREKNPHYLRQIWEEERGKLFAKLKENGQIDLLDHHLGADGLDVSVAPTAPKK